MKLSAFVQRQIKEVAAGRGPILARKIWLAAAALVAVPLVLGIRLLRPWIILQLGGINAGALGPLATSMELYLCERDAGWHGRRVRPLVWCSKEVVCNRQLVTMWKRVVWIHPFARTLDRVNRLLPGGRRHRLPVRIFDRDVHGLLATTRAHLTFTPGEQQQGEAALRALGIPEGVPFVCFSARDVAWSQSVPGGLRTRMDHRYSDIQTYLPAVETLVQRGYAALRMGAVVKDALPITNPRIIDYASRGRTDLMDVFLCAQCRFFLGDSGGLINLPMIFRRPFAQVNAVHLEYLWSWGPDDLIIPKKLWRRDERRFMTFREILASGAGRFLRTDLYEYHGIEVIGNTPEEITALVMEMEERLTGTWQTTAEDEALQHRVWSLIRQYSQPPPDRIAIRNGTARLGIGHDVIRARIGMEFLRQHRALLEDELPRPAPQVFDMSERIGAVAPR